MLTLLVVAVAVAVVVGLYLSHGCLESWATIAQPRAHTRESNPFQLFSARVVRVSRCTQNGWGGLRTCSLRSPDASSWRSLTSIQETRRGTAGGTCVSGLHVGLCRRWGYHACDTLGWLLLPLTERLCSL